MQLSRLKMSKKMLNKKILKNPFNNVERNLTQGIQALQDNARHCQALGSNQQMQAVTKALRRRKKKMGEKS